MAIMLTNTNTLDSRPLPLSEIEAARSMIRSVRQAAHEPTDAPLFADVHFLCDTAHDFPMLFEAPYTERFGMRA